MNGAEFIKRIRRIGRERGLAVRFNPRHGKGSHGRLDFGDRFMTIKERRKEIGPGLLAKNADAVGHTEGRSVKPRPWSDNGTNHLSR